MNKLKICVLGLGYVGLPLVLNISKKFDCIGFDLNKKRIENLKNKIDTNKEYSKKDLASHRLKFTDNLNIIKNFNFYIICVPTPIFKNKKPDLRNLNLAIKLISKVLKKNDILFIESTIYPGLTFCYKNYLEKKTKLKNNKDFFIGYSPERVNPGDKTNTIKDINKIVSINTNNKKILYNVIKVYKTVCKKIILSKDIKSAETAKVIENIQRDLNIALMNEFLLICKKLKINFKEVLNLAKTKWNFLKFSPGLVGGHCLPVDPYYLSSIAKKNKIKTLVTLSGRKINDGMKFHVINEIYKLIKFKKKRIRNVKILIFGITYKPGVADMRNSQNLEIFDSLIKDKINVQIYDPFVSKEAKIKLKVLDKISEKNYYDIYVFLSKHEKFREEYIKLVKKKKSHKILDPFEYYNLD